MRVVYAQCPTSTTYLGIAIDSGTRDELDNESGIAHFTEHMTFKGTQLRTSRKIISGIEGLGGDLNAFTGKEETVFYCTCSQRHVGRALDLLFDIVFNSTYPQSEMDKEVEVVVDEIESYNDSPSELIFDDFEAILFKNHPLGRNILGNTENLRKYKTQDILAYTKRMYRPEKMVLFVYGKEDSHLLRLIKATHDKYLGQILTPTIQQVVLNDSRLLTTGNQSGSNCIVNKGCHQSHVMMGARAYSGKHPLHLALFLVNNILGGPGLSSRLNIALREKAGLVYTVESTLTTYTDTGVWAVYFGCDRKDIERCKQLVTRELKKLIHAPLSERAVSAAKRQMCGQILLSYDNFENVAIGMGKRLLHYDRTQTCEELLSRIADITAEDMRQAAREVFSPDSLTILEYN